jgi:hypothetical protein
MKYPDGGGLTAAERPAGEQVRLAAAEMIEGGAGRGTCGIGRRVAAFRRCPSSGWLTLQLQHSVPEPFRPAAAATSQRILVDPAGWMRAPDPVGQLGVLRTAVFTGRRLRLRYRSSGHGEPEASRKEAERSAAERVVDPYGLVWCGCGSRRCPRRGRC